MPFSYPPIGNHISLGTNPTSGGFINFGTAAPNGYLMRSPTQSGDATRPGFNWTHNAILFDVGQPKDEVSIWGYNMTASATREKSVDTAIGFSIEGSYNAGANYTEAHLLYVNGSDVQFRPWSWRINKNNLADWLHYITTSSFQVINPADTGHQIFTVVPTSLTWKTTAAKAAGKALQLLDDGTLIQFSRTGGGTTDLTFAGFRNINLTGGTIFRNTESDIGQNVTWAISKGWKIQSSGPTTQVLARPDGSFAGLRFNPTFPLLWVATTAFNDPHVGLLPSATNTLRVVTNVSGTATGTLRFKLPTSSSGLESGELWNNGGTLTIVP